MTNPIQTWQITVELILDRLARDDHLMTYLEAAEEADIPSPYRIHQLAEFLEELIKKDAQLARPIRAARIVSKRDNLPADGFFECLADCGMAPNEGESKSAFHKRLLEA